MTPKKPVKIRENWVFKRRSGMGKWSLAPDGRVEGSYPFEKFLCLFQAFYGKRYTTAKNALMGVYLGENFTKNRTNYGVRLEKN